MGQLSKKLCKFCSTFLLLVMFEFVNLGGLDFIISINLLVKSLNVETGGFLSIDSEHPGDFFTT